MCVRAPLRIRRAPPSQTDRFPYSGYCISTADKLTNERKQRTRAALRELDARISVCSFRCKAPERYENLLVASLGCRVSILSHRMNVSVGKDRR